MSNNTEHNLSADELRKINPNLTENIDNDRILKFFRRYLGLDVYTVSYALLIVAVLALLNGSLVWSIFIINVDILLCVIMALCSDNNENDE